MFKLFIVYFCNSTLLMCPKILILVYRRCHVQSVTFLSTDWLNQLQQFVITKDYFKQTFYKEYVHYSFC